MDMKQAIVVRTDLKMGRGKIASQCAHASVAAISELPPAVFESWYADGMKKVVLRVGSKKELLELFKKAKRKFPVSIVKDAGLTQVKKGTLTVLSIGPAAEEDIDHLTGKLRLL